MLPATTDQKARGWSPFLRAIADQPTTSNGRSSGSTMGFRGGVSDGVQRAAELVGWPPSCAASPCLQRHAGWCVVVRELPGLRAYQGVQLPTLERYDS